MFKISSSTYQRLKWGLEEIYFEESDGSSFKDEQNKDWEMAKIIMQNFVTPSWHPITIDKIRQKYGKLEVWYTALQDSYIYSKIDQMKI